MLTQILAAFLEGIAIIVSPCILTILPIILVVGVTGGRKRPYGIILGFILAFCAFTLLSREIVLTLGLDPSFIRLISYILLLLFGLMLVFKVGLARFELYTARVATFGQELGRYSERREGLWGGLILGFTLGFVWTPCAGPILAAVLVQAIQGETTFDSAMILLSFSLGAGIPMLLLTLLGRQSISHLWFLKRYGGHMQRIIGLIIIGTVLYTGGGELWGGFKQISFSKTERGGVDQASVIRGNRLIKGLSMSYKAPEWGSTGEWINTKPLTLGDLKGKVVLIDFWTYSCINCVRTLPYLTQWYDTYKDKGLVVIGIHAPEFEFEKNRANVEAAVKDHNIHYPVVLDNQFEAWRAYDNHYWPAHYLIDRDGNVVYVHFGEGQYDVTENNIRYLLGLDGPMEKSGPSSHEAARQDQTPETYLGAARTNRFASSEAFSLAEKGTYTIPQALNIHEWGLKGKWSVTPEYCESKGENDALVIHFAAKKVFLVMAPADGKPVKVHLKLDDDDVRGKGLTVDKDSLYELIHLSEFREGILEIKPESPGLRVYAFTFGA